MRTSYATGPTTGDRVRLGDADLWVRVQEDRTARGDEPIWGYAKNLHSRMAQSDSATGPPELDVVLTGALVIDPVIGVVKADIGIKDGRIAVIGRHTKSHMAYKLIATPGAVDTRVHTIGPELPAAGSGGRRDHAHHRWLRGAAVGDRAGARRPRGGWPVNIGMQAGARAEEDSHLDALVDKGALGFRIHEDNGAYPG